MLNSVHITYDGEGDTLYIAFGDASPATGYQLSDQILLRMAPEGDAPVGLTIFNFLHHVGSGARIELGDVEDDLMKALASEPVSRFLDVQHNGNRAVARLLEPSLRESVMAAG